MDEPGQMLKCLRLIHAAYDADGADLSAWPEKAADEIERIADELMERECDARRYRWLRSRDLDAITSGGVFAGMTPANVVLNGEDLDSAIDDCIRRELLAFLTPND